MSTSPATSFLYEIGAKLPIPLEKRAYFHARLTNRIYAFILDKFLEKERSEKLTKAELARRIGRKPETITRLLGAPGNWTLETISDLLLGIAGEELEPASSSLLNRPHRNINVAELMNHIQQTKQVQGQLPPIDPVSKGLVLRSPDNANRPKAMLHSLEQAA
jgi:hypothetical protein